MADIALFHSALGVRPGVLDAADRLRAEDHKVVVVDQYDGRVFDDYNEERVRRVERATRSASSVAVKSNTRIQPKLNTAGQRVDLFNLHPMVAINLHCIPTFVVEMQPRFEKSGVVLEEEPQPRWANEPSYLILGP